MTPSDGDFNDDGTVDAADYVVWRNGLGTLFTQSDYDIWRVNFGKSLNPGSGSARYGHRDSAPLASAEPLSAAVPEPTSKTFLVMVAAMLSLSKARRRQHMCDR
jgi:hypothetical protein